VLRPKTDLEYDRYPVSFMSWEREGRSYHGVSPLTGKRPNQIFVNKLYAMAMEYAKNMAFPKLLYNKTKIPKWDGSPGKAIAVNGDPREALFASFPAADMSVQALNLANATIVQTKEMMGAYDAALGNVNPTNTSAIIAVQQAASMPLDLQRLDFYQFVEDTLRIWLAIMEKDYGLRAVGDQEVLFDFGRLGEFAPSLMVEVGPAAYWSEIRQIQSLDNLLHNQIIPDAETYLESMPDGYIRGKRNILEKVKQKNRREEMERLMGGGV